MPRAALVIPASSPDLSALVRAARQGDASALGALYDLYAPSLYRTALRLAGDRDDAEDVVHDCFVGLPNALRQYDERGRLDAWLRKLIVRLVLMRRRGTERRREISLDVTATLAGPSRTEASAELVDVRRAIKALPRALRDVLVLKEIEGYGHDEIAQLLGISAGASRTRLTRALNQLGRMLAPRR